MDEIKQEPTEPINLDALDDLDKSIIMLKIQGLKITEIAERLNRDRGTISGRLEKFQVQETIKEYQKTAMEIITSAHADAARELKRQVKKGETDRDKREAAKEILKGINPEKLDLSGTGEPLNIKIEFVKKEDENV